MAKNTRNVKAISRAEKPKAVKAGEKMGGEGGNRGEKMFKVKRKRRIYVYTCMHKTDT